MGAKFDDRAWETATAAGGTGNFTMLGAVQTGGAISFGTFLTATGDLTTYEADNSGAAWETGIITRQSDGTYARTVKRSTNSNNAVNFSGVLNIKCAPPAWLFDHLNMIEETLASAATTDLGSVQTKYIQLTGTTGITGFGTSKNKNRVVRYTGGGLTITGGATLVLPAAAATLILNTGDIFEAKSDNSATPIWRVSNVQSGLYPPFAGKLIRAPQIFTASGTWTRPAGCRTVVVEVIGGGGAGGGCTDQAASQFAIGGGGGGGGYSIKRVTTPGATETVTIGAAGTAGTGSGGTGGTTSFGSHCSATGGAGGGAGTSAANVNTLGGVGGAGSGGDVNLAGQGGGGGFGSQAGGTINLSGRGGNAARGGGGAVDQTANANGSAGGSYGGGGSGGAGYNASGTKTGGAGAAGVVIVWEYE